MKRMLITGGAGFIGVNCVRYFLQRGWHVVSLDNLSRKGSELNLALIRNYKGNFDFIHCDISNSHDLLYKLKDHRFDAIIHLAAQVAVTTSVVDPRRDFEINAWGTFNVLEYCRQFCPEALLIYASTNKVYGKMEDQIIVEKQGRYEYRDLPNGISEQRSLDFYSPYGCSKGSADQYVLDYARIYGLLSTSFRQSCIFGPHQFGLEDQGWLAWFTIAAAAGLPITVYGNGKQIRDVLHVDDLLLAYEQAISNPDKVAGEAFNIGGGKENTMSLLELIDYLESKFNVKLGPKFADWRPGDQSVYVSDIDKISNLLNWKPIIDTEKGLSGLCNWVVENLQSIKTVLNSD